MLQQKLKKIRDLKKLNKKVGEFISVTVKKDNSVKEQIEKAKEEFYTKYSYLKPECEKMDWKKCVMEYIVLEAGLWITLKRYL